MQTEGIGHLMITPRRAAPLLYWAATLAPNIHRWRLVHGFFEVPLVGPVAHRMPTVTQSK